MALFTNVTNVVSGRSLPGRFARRQPHSGGPVCHPAVMPSGGRKRSDVWLRWTASLAWLGALVVFGLYGLLAAAPLCPHAAAADSAAQVLAGQETPAEADAPVFRPGRSGKGQLRFINEVAVLSVEGTPQEIGRQQAELIGAAANQLAQYPQEFFKRLGKQEQWETVVQRARALAENIPEQHRAEMAAFAEHAGGDRQLGLVANVLPDMYRSVFACSSLIVTTQRSATGEPLFGRNLDFFTLGVLDRYSLVTVYRPKGKNAFAAVGFPGLFGVFSGINEHGLALAVHEVLLARDGSPMFDPKGVPYAFCFRRILEECRTVEEAEKLLLDTPRTTRLNLAVCDRKSAAVIEMTPKTVALRRDEAGICICTNHFRTKQLETLFVCRRYLTLSQAKQTEKLSLDDVAKKLDQVNQGALTVQTMVFEPQRLRLHLAAGSCPSSALPLKLVELKPLFSPEAPAEKP